MMLHFTTAVSLVETSPVSSKLSGFLPANFTGVNTLAEIRTLR